jgi:hypothetical protein
MDIRERRESKREREEMRCEDGTVDEKGRKEIIKLNHRMR